jgi:hypothetical protein
MGRKASSRSDRARQAQAQEEEEAIVSSRKPPTTAAGCRNYIRGELTEGFPQIVQGFVKAAKSGSVPHVKLATEILQTAAPKKPRRSPAMAALMRRMVAD